MARHAAEQFASADCFVGAGAMSSGAAREGICLRADNLSARPTWP